MPIETGSWTIVVNGMNGQLIISSSDPQGKVGGKLQLPIGGPIGGPPILIEGVWNEQSNELIFSAFAPIPPYPPAMVFTGYVFGDQNRLPGIQGGKVYTLAGTMLIFANGQGFMTGSADQSEFGWYAQIGVE